MENRKLKGKLKENGFTYESIAEKIGISTSAFCNKINGDNRFTVDEAARLSAELGLTVEEKVNIFLS